MSEPATEARAALLILDSGGTLSPERIRILAEAVLDLDAALAAAMQGEGLPAGVSEE